MQARMSVGRRLLLALVVVGLMIVSLGAMSPVGAAPPGNNGTVKIDGVAFDDHPNNEPHVGCTFQVDFYGYDLGDLSADVTFEAQPPTGNAVLLTDADIFIGEDAAGGGTDLDATRTYDLSPYLVGFTPHPQQGFHIKLTVNAEGSIGADVKHKVFWVEGCDPPVTTTTTSTTVPADGTIIIEKYALPYGQTVFYFTGSLGDFSIIDSAQGTGNPGSQVTFTGLSSDTYTVTEIDLAGWTLTNIDCTVTGTSSTVTVDVQAGTATINLVSGETVYCDFRNYKDKY